MSNVRRFGDYYLLKKIAAGGMAELYKAKKSGEKGFEKMLAIKMILPHLSTNDDFISMFIDEAKVAALLSHQNIVQIFDLGKIEKSYCIVMEYVRGRDLRSVIRRATKKKTPLSPEHACLITSSVLAGLGYAHRMKNKGKELNIVHRDISPQNVIVSYEGEVKVVDFGIAKAATQSRDTQAGVLKGKLAYMSPEQAYGRPLDGRSDIFSVGIVLYEMLTGEKLFQSDTDLGTLELVRNASVEPIHMNMDGRFPGELKEVLLKALAKNPDDRYQSAAEMESAVQDVMRTLGYSSSGYSLSEYMYRLFKDEIDEELDEEVEWGQTMVSDKLLEETLTGSKQDVTSPDRVDEAGGKPQKPARVPVADEPSVSIKIAGRKSEGGLGKVFVGLVMLVLIAGAGIYGMKHYRKEIEAVKHRIVPSAAEAPPPGQVEETEPVAEPVTEPETATEVPAGQEQEPVAGAEPAPEPETGAEPEPAPEAEAEPEPVTEPKPKPKPAPPPAAEVLPITVAFNSEPLGASVYVDGVYSGDAPLTVGDLKPDVAHSVTMTLKGYQDWKGNVSAGPGTLETVNAEMKESLYSLEVDSIPAGAHILLNGQDTGKLTPSVIDGLKPGLDQALELRKPGHKTYTEVVNRQEGGTAKVTARLVREFGKLTINSKPWSYVIIEGDNKGMTPLAGLEMPVGEYEIVLENPKLKLRKIVKVVIRPDETTRVVIPLDRKR